MCLAPFSRARSSHWSAASWRAFRLLDSAERVMVERTSKFQNLISQEGNIRIFIIKILVNIEKIENNISDLFFEHRQPIFQKQLQKRPLKEFSSAEMRSKPTQFQTQTLAHPKSSAPQISQLPARSLLQLFRLKKRPIRHKNHHTRILRNHSNRLNHRPFRVNIRLKTQLIRLKNLPARYT